MALLQEARTLSAGTAALTETQRRALAAVFWEWFRFHASDVIIKRKVLVFSVTVKVSDLRHVFVALFGEEVVA